MTPPAVSDTPPNGVTAAHITELVTFAANVQISHWEADTLTSAHETLGKLYSRLIAEVDTLAELYMGKTENRTGFAATVNLADNADLADLLDSGLDIVNRARTGTVAGKDDDILNVLADISAAINHTRYLLRV